MKQFGVPHLHKGIHVEKYSSYQAIDMPMMHSHEYHELYFLVSGERRYFKGHEIYDIHPGEMVVIPKDILHRTTALNCIGYERYVIYFREEYLQELINFVGKDDIDTLLGMGCISFSEEGIEFIKSRFKELDNESKINDNYTCAMEKNLLEQIILYILRYGNCKPSEKKFGADKIEEAAKYISEHYFDEITLSDVAAKAYMEETYFSKKFKQMTGFGFKEYLLMTRIKAAQELLLTTDKNIGEISEMCGFMSSNYFGDVFKKHCGQSPSDFRKKNY